MRESLTVQWDEDGQVLFVTGSPEAMQLIKETFQRAFGNDDARDESDIHAHATFYAEVDSEIIGITDDENGCVMTRDGESPVASIHLYACK